MFLEIYCISLDLIFGVCFGFRGYLGIMGFGDFVVKCEFVERREFGKRFGGICF